MKFEGWELGEGGRGKALFFFDYFIMWRNNMTYDNFCVWGLPSLSLFTASSINVCKNIFELFREK